MLKSILKVFWRNISRNKLYAFLNIFGLATGVSGAILIAIYVNFELSYENFHPNIENKYIMALDSKVGESRSYHTSTPPVLAKAAKNQLSSVKSTTRVSDVENLVLEYKENSYYQEKVFWADSNFFEFFGYELKYGDPKTVLNRPYQMVITTEMANKYFGQDNPIGRAIEVGFSSQEFIVSGVANTPQENSHLDFKILLSYTTNSLSESNNWLGNSLLTYIELDEDTDVSTLQEQIDALVKEGANPIFKEVFDKSFEKIEEAGKWYTYRPISLLDYHLRTPELGHTIGNPSDVYYIYLFSAIGVFLILIAAINFMNLTTASASKRAKEVSLRKTLGSHRITMIYQFFVESACYVIISVLLSVLLVVQLAPYFYQILNLDISLMVMLEPWFVGLLLALIVVVTLLAGGYPAFYLTSFKPGTILKSQFRAGKKPKQFRQALVVGQFFISIALIISTLLMSDQLNYMQSKDLGINKTQSIVLENTSQLADAQLVFKEELMKQSAIASASYTSHTVPGYHYSTFIKRPEEINDHVIPMFWADYEHAEVLEIDMVEGRYFSRDYAIDSAAVVMNKSAVNEFGFKDPISKEVVYNGDRYKIIGVMEDFHFESPVYEIEPLVLFFTETANEMIVRFNSDQPAEAIETIKTIWEKYATNSPLKYSFLDDDFAQQFANDQRRSTLFGVFTVVAIIIACLGLIGLSTYMAEQRTKEIGIRKVLGASVNSILKLFSKDFIKLVLIAFVLAIPVAIYFINNWLKDFAFRIDISPQVFIVTGLVAFGLVMFSISWQAIKAAFMNPVESLRNE